MKQTIVDLSRWAHVVVPFSSCTKEDRDIVEKIYFKGKRPSWNTIFQDCRDAAFMMALTEKAGLPYQSKLIALQLEGVELR